MRLLKFALIIISLSNFYPTLSMNYSKNRLAQDLLNDEATRLESLKKIIELQGSDNPANAKGIKHLTASLAYAQEFEECEHKPLFSGLIQNCYRLKYYKNLREILALGIKYNSELIVKELMNYPGINKLSRTTVGTVFTQERTTTESLPGALEMFKDSIDFNRDPEKMAKLILNNLELDDLNRQKFADIQDPAKFLERIPNYIKDNCVNREVAPEFQKFCRVTNKVLVEMLSERIEL